MHVFSQVFITDLICNSGADCGGVVVCFMDYFSFLLTSAVSSSQGFGEEVVQTAAYLWTTCFDQ